MTDACILPAQHARSPARSDAGPLRVDDAPAVMILGDHFGYPGNVVHGVTTYYLHVIPALAASGVPIRACFLREPHPAAEGLRRHGIGPTFLSAGKWNPLVAFRVAALIREQGCQVVHACGVKATLIARIAARLTGAGVIVHVHDLLYPAAPVGAMHRLFGTGADVGVGVSQAVRKVVVNGYHVDPRRARVIHNGIPLGQIEAVAPDARSHLRNELEIADGVDAILMIARMHPIKGHRTMLRILSRIMAQRPDAVLVLAGDGPERAACETLATELGLGRNIRFLGSRSDVPELLAACDVVVIPSDSEGLPTVAIEAGAAGRPVIGFDAGGLRDVVVDGVSGRLIVAADEEGFAAALVEMLSHPEVLAGYGAQARIAARHFTLDSHVRQLVQCYRDVAGSAAARSAARA